MAVFAIILMVLGMVATLAILATGIYSMVRGGEFNDRWGNRLMRYRIVAQGFALAMFALGLMLLDVQRPKQSWTQPEPPVSLPAWLN